jgi:hypothetical protein
VGVPRGTTKEEENDGKKTEKQEGIAAGDDWDRWDDESKHRQPGWNGGRGFRLEQERHH